jgi:hypothetical protein
MKYRYRAVERFWTSFYRLAPAQKESARRAWIIFKEDPSIPACERIKSKGFRRSTAARSKLWKLKAIYVPPFIWMAKQWFR